jgi:hypothetical protein
MAPKVMIKDDDNGKTKGMAIKEVKSSELEEVSLDAPAGVAPSTPSTPKQLTKSQSKGKATDSPRVPMKSAKLVSKSSR